MATEWSGGMPKANNALEQRLGFRIEVAEGREAGTVVWFGSDIGAGVRPATGVEIALWQEIERLNARNAPGGVPAESVSDPFGTTKGAGSDGIGTSN
jgi:hypothetical protein